MIGKIGGTLWLAIVLGGCATSSGGPAPVYSVTPPPTVVPAAVPPPPSPPPAVVIPESVPSQPSTAALEGLHVHHVALLLPLNSGPLATAADAVRAGFSDARDKANEGIEVDVVPTDGTPQSMLAAYATAANTADVVVGPLARSEVSALAQSGAVSRPTIALGQPESGNAAAPAPLPVAFIAIGLSLEDEARQVAQLMAADKTLQHVLIVSTATAWQKRAAQAFAAQWQTLGQQAAQSIELPLVDSFFTPASLVDLKKRLDTDPPQAIFVALDAAQTAQLRLAVGTIVPMYGTSQLNPHTAQDWALAEPMPDMNGVRLVDIPWLLQTPAPAPGMPPADDPASAAPAADAGVPPATGPGVPVPAPGQVPHRGANLERLYALGMDAYQIVHELAAGRTEMQLTGATGQLNVRLSNSGSQFSRSEQPAQYSDGKVTAAEGGW